MCYVKQVFRDQARYKASSLLISDAASRTLRENFNVDTGEKNHICKVIAYKRFRVRVHLFDI